MTAFTKIMLIGASGSIGTVVLNAFKNDPAFILTILQRSSSKSKILSHIRTILINDTYPTEELISAFHGQDVIINCMTSLSVADQFRMVDAAIAAGVKRYIPSEYGLNNLRPEAQALNSVFRDKGKVQEYLRSRAADGVIEWMSISCGMWLKWSMAHNFLGMHVSERRFVFWDDGQGLFSCTTEENTAAGLIRALKMPKITKNTNIYLSDFAISQHQLLEAIERIQGTRYTTERINSDALISEKQNAVIAGDDSAVFALIETGFVTGKFGGHLEKEGQIMNEVLGLRHHSLDEVVADALKCLHNI